MRRKTLHNAKLVITVESNQHAEGPIKIKTLSVFDNRTQKLWTDEQIAERGLNSGFLDVADMKMSLNWNLNGDESKYQFKWGHSANGVSQGVAYIFN